MTTTTRHKHSRNEYDFYSDLDHIRDAVYDATQHAKGRATKLLAESFENVKDKSSDLKDNVEEYIENKPLKSLGIALLAGMFIGFLLRK